MTTVSPSHEALLPADALNGVRLGISVSDSPDLSRLGLLESHFRLALGEIARCVLVSGGSLAYGGDLRAEGYTAFLMQELQRYSRRNHPLHVCLAWTMHQQMGLSDITSAQQAFGLSAKLKCIDLAGDEVDPAVNRPPTAPVTFDSEIKAKSLHALRRYIAQHTTGQILLGGKRDGFEGSMPGVLEEAICALEFGHPLYLAGGFGGATLDVISTLGIDDISWLPIWPSANEINDKLLTGLQQLKELVSNTGWTATNNGLTAEENLRLARTCRPSEIAALISLGLGRRARNDPAS